MTYQTEFPDYPADALPELPEGFTDRSWRNELSPCFIHDASGLVLWCDYPAAEAREFPDAARFTLHKCIGRHPTAGWQFDESMLIIGSAEAWDDMAALIAKELAA